MDAYTPFEHQQQQQSLADTEVPLAAMYISDDAIMQQSSHMLADSAMVFDTLPDGHINGGHVSVDVVLSDLSASSPVHHDGSISSMTSATTTSVPNDCISSIDVDSILMATADADYSNEDNMIVDMSVTEGDDSAAAASIASIPSESELNQYLALASAVGHGVDVTLQSQQQPDAVASPLGVDVEQQQPFMFDGAGEEHLHQQTVAKRRS